jgi:hypothetical protein
VIALVAGVLGVLGAGLPEAGALGGGVAVDGLGGGLRELGAALDGGGGGGADEEGGGAEEGGREGVGALLEGLLDGLEGGEVLAVGDGPADDAVPPGRVDGPGEPPADDGGADGPRDAPGAVEPGDAVDHGIVDCGGVVAPPLVRSAATLSVTYSPNRSSVPAGGSDAVTRASSGGRALPT